MINCVWSETSLDADNRSHYAIATLVNNALDRAELGFVHRNGFKQLPSDADGAVVIVHGEHQVNKSQELFNDLTRLKWAVVIVIGDDGALFPSEFIHGCLPKGRCKLWLQMAVPQRHHFIDRRIICGFPHDAPAFLGHELGKDRIYEWSYAGQVNHRWRRECVNVLRNLPKGYLYESPGFWNGIPRDQYYRVMAQSKIVACPAGACTPDTLRMAEALEAGCVPIVEDRWPPNFPRGASGVTTGYWRWVLGEQPPFPIITDWSQFPSMLAEHLVDWENRALRLKFWWHMYKEKQWRWLEEDVRTCMNS